MGSAEAAPASGLEAFSSLAGPITKGSGQSEASAASPGRRGVLPGGSAGSWLGSCLSGGWFMVLDSVRREGKAKAGPEEDPDNPPGSACMTWIAQVRPPLCGLLLALGSVRGMAWPGMGGSLLVSCTVQETCTVE